MNNDIIQMIGFIVIGILLLIGYYLNSNRSKEIFENGIEVEGIVFEFVQDQSFFNDINNNSSYPVIRFLTKEKKWITARPIEELSSIFFKTGEKVTVIYNRDNPEEFILKTKLTPKGVSYILLIVGFCILGYGLFLAFNYLKS